ncbi:hypothetical protein [Acidovorax sp. RAC01]|uniref:hypothetical protein n=1 Tax=Acidovorax sp. RAC01 TaxID=1842533 RepID=UPI00083E8AFE|nr:hypothetical protein [Acidovorax sp. RAC01]AOG21713.1 hypothetical protein BSY15_3750 [Acidovorax sp. RAC01]AOG24947.1 hypothetical protein BSY15_3828 [Acidovorax sp. RAC01]
MEFTARILHTNGQVTTKEIRTADDLSGARLTGDGLMPACSALRKADQTVAAVKIAVPGFADYVWSGHATQEHMAAIVARERAGTDNW